MKALALLLPTALAALATLASTPALAQASACKDTEEAEIAVLFNHWNDALKTGQADRIVALYAPDSLLLPTLSATPRLTPEAKRDYFDHFLARTPVGSIDSRTIRIGCNTAVASGLYTFRFSDGSATPARYTYTYAWNGERWLITSHHSSALPAQ